MNKEDKINQNQFYDLITSEELSWQSIIYDLIKTEQLDPWDIDLTILANKYVEVITSLEEANFFISSKVLLACSLLLRLKSEILINSYIQDLNDALYGRKEDERRTEFERLEIDENELPILVPRTPMARHKKVTLKDLIEALDHAVNTENRRIKREIKDRQAERSALVVMPKNNFIPLNVRIKSIHQIVKNHIGQGNDHMKFSHLAQDKEEKLASFVPILHLSNNEKLFLRQKVHFDDIHMTLSQHPEEKQEMINELGLHDGDDGYTEESFEEFDDNLTDEDFVEIN